MSHRSLSFVKSLSQFLILDFTGPFGCIGVGGRRHGVREAAVARLEARLNVVHELGVGGACGGACFVQLFEPRLLLRDSLLQEGHVLPAGFELALLHGVNRVLEELREGP